jgi:arginase
LNLKLTIYLLTSFRSTFSGTAVRGGLTFREGNYVCEAVAETGKLRSMELVEVNPSLHPGVDPKHTIEMALTLVGSAMGRTIL